MVPIEVRTTNINTSFGRVRRARHFGRGSTSVFPVWCIIRGIGKGNVEGGGEGRGDMRAA